MFCWHNVSQSSVASHTRCGGSFSMPLTAILPGNFPEKKFFKSVKIWQNYGRESVARFLVHPVYLAGHQRRVICSLVHYHERSVINIITAVAFFSSSMSLVTHRWLHQHRRLENVHISSHSASRWLSGDVVVGNITFWWFLQFLIRPR